MDDVVVYLKSGKKILVENTNFDKFKEAIKELGGKSYILTDDVFIKFSEIAAIRKKNSRNMD